MLFKQKKAWKDKADQNPSFFIFLTAQYRKYRKIKQNIWIIVVIKGLICLPKITNLVEKTNKGSIYKEIKQR